jgi:hypothetical protein
MTDGSFPSILEQATANPEASFPGFGMEARFRKGFPGLALPKGSRLILDGSGSISLSIPSSPGSRTLPGLYAGRMPSGEMPGWIRQLRESGIDKHVEDQSEAADIAVSAVSAGHAFRFFINYADKAFLKFRPALDSLAAQALKSPLWALSLAVQSNPRPAKSGTDLLLEFSNRGSRGIWIDSPAQPVAPEDAQVCEVEFARKPQIEPVTDFERIKRSTSPILFLEAGAPLLWLGPRMSVRLKAKATFPGHENVLARVKYRSDSGVGIDPGMPRFIGTLVSPVFEAQA